MPDLDFSLREGDVVDVTIDGVGRLSNPVATVETVRGRRGDAPVGSALS